MFRGMLLATLLLSSFSAGAASALLEVELSLCSSLCRQRVEY